MLDALAHDRALWALRTWLDSWLSIGHVAARMHRQGFDLQLTQYDDRGWRGDVLHDRDGALANERDEHRVGAHAVARDAAGGVGERWTAQAANSYISPITEEKT